MQLALIMKRNGRTASSGCSWFLRWCLLICVVARAVRGSCADLRCKSLIFELSCAPQLTNCQCVCARSCRSSFFVVTWVFFNMCVMTICVHSVCGSYFRPRPCATIVLIFMLPVSSGVFRCVQRLGAVQQLFWYICRKIASGIEISGSKNRLHPRGTPSSKTLHGLSAKSGMRYAR